MKSQLESPLEEHPAGEEPLRPSLSASVVTARAFVLGLLLAAGLSALNAWIELVADVHFLGGMQMPFGAIFSLLMLVIVVNGPLRWLRRALRSSPGVLSPLSAVELLTVYVMLLFAALISTPGTDNFFLSTGPALFYYSTRENGWASLFYRFIPPQFAPGWNGTTFQRQVVEPFFQGGLSPSQIPWHAWTEMLLSWGVLLLLVYSTLFFASLLLRRQWIENEALSFPLIQLPLEMAQSGPASDGNRGFWNNGTMWMGFGLAAFVHLLRGMNFYFPDWPQIGAFHGNPFDIVFTEAPWNAVGIVRSQFYLGAIGVAFLLNRELSFSLWFFLLFYKLQLVGATMLGYPAGMLPKDSYLGRPTFITWQSTGGWLMTAALLLWRARGHFASFWRDALHPRRAGSREGNEPFPAWLVLLGLAASGAGVIGWCWFAGLNLLAALAFFALYGVASLVLARLVVEGGVLFPQVTFGSLEVLGGAFLSSSAIGAASLTKFSFLQPMFFSDMRTTLLPGFFHLLKIAHELRLERRDTRRLLLAGACAIALSLFVSLFVILVTVYRVGGLSSYLWFTQDGPQSSFKGTAIMLSAPSSVQASNWLWMGVGALIVLGLTLARERFLWLPFHPLAFIVSSGYPTERLWQSFFIGWAVKSLLFRFGGQQGVVRARPFMIGLILGNAVGMVAWMIVGFFLGSQVPYWSA